MLKEIWYHDISIITSQFTVYQIESLIDVNLSWQTIYPFKTNIQTTFSQTQHSSTNDKMHLFMTKFHIKNYSYIKYIFFYTSASWKHVKSFYISLMRWWTTVHSQFNSGRERHLLFFPAWQSYRLKYFHMPRQHTCYIMCEILQQWFYQNLDESKTQFSSNINYDIYRYWSGLIGCYHVLEIRFKIPDILYDYHPSDAPCKHTTQ